MPTMRTSMAPPLEPGGIYEKHGQNTGQGVHAQDSSCAHWLLEFVSTWLYDCEQVSLSF